MPFSASLVMGKGGPTAYIIPMSSLPAGSSYTTVATQDVPAGTWLVAAVISARNGFSTPAVRVNGVEIWGQTAISSPASSATTVTGPVTVVVEVKQVNSGTVYISKLP